MQARVSGKVFQRMARSTTKFAIKPQQQLTYPKMPYVTMINNHRANVSSLMGSRIQMRQFSSLPDHIKLEMPNLSPTMEKVSS